VPTRPTPNCAPKTPGRLVVLLFLLLGGGVATAPAAFAVDDLTRPTATVTHGPSCRPGGVEIQVVAGSAPYSVVLATTRYPEGEDTATLAPGQTVLLHTGDVAWGETIDSRLQYTARDGSGVAYVDELEPYSFTRPSEEDCAAIAAPTQAVEPAPGAVPAPAVGDGSAPDGQTVPVPLAEPADGGKGAGLAVAPAAADRPVTPVTQPPTWPALAAGAALLASFCGVAVVGLRRRAGAGSGSRPGSG
jgi:hypothetical protein